MKKLLGITLCLLFALSASAVLPLSPQKSALFAARAEEAFRYGKSTITNGNVRYVYDLLEGELLKENPPESLALDEARGVTAAELSEAYSLFLSDCPECFWLQSRYGYSYVGETVVNVTPHYAFTGTALSAARADLNAAALGILEGMPAANDYEKALYLHDALAARVTYEMTGLHQTAYGALVAGKAVCAGYAAAYQLLLSYAGIPAWTVTGFSARPGESDPVGHAWNVVWLEEDLCVYTDVTWDDGEGETYHYYFNLSKAEMEADHQASPDLPPLPSCNHDALSYFDQNGAVVTDSTDIADLAAFFSPAEGGKRYAEFCYAGEDVNAFLSRLSANQTALYDALGCGFGSCGYSLTVLTGEIHLTVTGNFEEEVLPSLDPSEEPSETPSLEPSLTPSAEPSEAPSAEPSTPPGETPSETPSEAPSAIPSETPSEFPSAEPTEVPSASASVEPSVPALNPSSAPSESVQKDSAFLSFVKKNKTLVGSAAVVLFTALVIFAIVKTKR